jgi:hypothetical protein
MAILSLFAFAFAFGECALKERTSRATSNNHQRQQLICLLHSNPTLHPAFPSHTGLARQVCRQYASSLISKTRKHTNTQKTMDSGGKMGDLLATASVMAPLTSTSSAPRSSGAIDTLDEPVSETIVSLSLFDAPRREPASARVRCTSKHVNNQHSSTPARVRCVFVLTTRSTNSPTHQHTTHTTHTPPVVAFLDLDDEKHLSTGHQLVASRTQHVGLYSRVKAERTQEATTAAQTTHSHKTHNSTKTLTHTNENTYTHTHTHTHTKQNKKQLRDLKLVGVKLKHVLIPTGGTEELRNWDLWGPLLLCLSLAISLSFSTKSDETALKFAIVFVIVWCGAGVVTINAALLGGKISFLQSVCVLGYCLAPLCMASITLRLVNMLFDSRVVDAILVFIAFAWSTRASVGFIGQCLPDEKRALAVYPVLLFYLFIGWMILVQDS